MANRVLSIDVGYSLTKIAEVEYNKKNSKVYQCFSVETPDGVVEDGYIQNPEVFGEALRGELQKRGIKTKKAIFTITSSKIANRDVMAPELKPKMLQPFVVSKAPEYFPVDVNAYQFAYHVLEKAESEGNKQLRLMVLAAPKDLLGTYYRFAEKMGLSIEALDYSGNSILPVIHAEVGEEITLVVKVDERATLLTVLNKDHVIMQRNVAYGADSAIQAILDEDVFECETYMDALNLLRGKTVIRQNLESEEPDEEDAANNNERVRQARMDVTESLGMLIGSISRVMDYYNSRNAEHAIERVFLTGFGGDFSGLSRLMTNELGIKVKTMSDFKSSHFERSAKKDTISVGEYIACIGAAIEPLNLLLEEFSKKKKKANLSLKKKGGGLAAPSAATLEITGWVLLGLSLVASGVLAALAIIPYRQLLARNQDLNNQVNTMLPIVDIYNNYVTEKALYEEVVALDEMTRTRNEGLSAFMQEMERKIPSNTVVTSFDSDGQVVNIGFQSSSKEEAARIINELRSFDSVASISVTAINEEVDTETGVRVEEYSVSCVFRPVDWVDPEEEGTEESGDGTSETARIEMNGRGGRS